MKKKILTLSIIVVLISAIALCGLLLAEPNSVADAGNKIDYYLFVENPNNSIRDEINLITNKQAGVYLNPYSNADFMFFIRNESSLDKLKITNDITYLPIKDETTYYIGYSIPDLKLEFDVAQITYDLKSPVVSAKANDCNLNNNSCVIVQQVTISAYDNLSGVQLFMVKDEEEPTLCGLTTYSIMENGTYTFYAVDVAGNRSNDFIVTYYREEPVKHPEDSHTQDGPTTPEEEQDKGKGNTVAQNAGIITVIAIFLFAETVIGAIALYRKIRAKASHNNYNSE